MSIIKNEAVRSTILATFGANTEVVVSGLPAEGGVTIAGTNALLNLDVKGKFTVGQVLVVADDGDMVIKGVAKPTVKKLNPSREQLAAMGYKF